MVDTTGPSIEDQEVEIAALTFECRLAVEAALLRTRQLDRIPASPTMRAELDRVVRIMEQMAEAFNDLHGAITRLLCPGGRVPQADMPAASHRDIEEVGAAILSADRPLGGYIGEADLAESLGKEHSVVRDAAIWLEGRGLVKRMGDLGVRPNSFSETDLRDLFEIREVFEPIACGLAAAAMSDEEISCVRGTLDQRGAPREGRFSRESEYPQYDDFHVQIILGSKNPSLIELLCDNLHYKLRFYRESFRISPEWAERAMAERSAIVDALTQRDASRAASAMLRHLATTRAATQWTGRTPEHCNVEDFASYRRAKRMAPQ